MKKSFTTPRLTGPRPRAEPRGAALVYGYVTRDGRQIPAILTVDRSRYPGPAVKAATAKRSISPKLYRRRQAELASLAEAA